VIVAFVVGCVLALLGPLLVHTLLFASLKEATSFFSHGELLAKEAALVYVVAVVVIAIAGGMYARGRRVPPVVLELAAIAPFACAVVGCVVRDPVRTAKLVLWPRADDFAENVASSEVVLDVAATMTTFAMMLVVLAAVIRHGSHRDGARTILVATVSAIVFAGLAGRAYGRYALFHALLQGMWTDAFAGVPRAWSIFSATRIIAVVTSVIAIGAGIVIARRIREPHGKSALAFMVIAGLLVAVPIAIAARDDGLFHRPNLAAIPDGVHVPSTELAWEESPWGGEPRMVVNRDGERLFDARDGKLRPMTDRDFDHAPLGCVVDRDATIASFEKAMPTDAVPKPIWLTFYVEPANRPDVSSAGALATLLAGTSWTTDVRFGNPDPSSECAFIALGEPLRVFHGGKPEALALPSGNDKPAIAARRAAFAGIRELYAGYNVYIRVRPTDKIGDVWRIVEDVHSLSRFSPRIVLADRDYVDRATYQRQMNEGNVW
jgi:hypothetical protein